MAAVVKLENRGIEMVFEVARPEPGALERVADAYDAWSVAAIAGDENTHLFNAYVRELESYAGIGFRAGAIEGSAA